MSVSMNHHKATKSTNIKNMILVGGLEHEFYFP